MKNRDRMLSAQVIEPPDPMGPTASRTSTPLFHPRADDLDLFQVFSALSAPLRLSAVKMLDEEGEIACSDFDLPVAKSAGSRHIRVPREAGVIHQRDVGGTRRLNVLRRKELEGRFPGLLDMFFKRHAALRSQGIC
ncbi:ArsR/SmtB family transcription factor [Streptomyces sp. NPDC056910]|uniref:ArsR/SmtB family transcription factor n=1 Tax=Streptomyces sp. NPDC056910 TaxID=3345964 RepID=UPI0036ABE1C2